MTMRSRIFWSLFAIRAMGLFRSRCRSRVEQISRSRWRSSAKRAWRGWFSVAPKEERSAHKMERYAPCSALSNSFIVMVLLTWFLARVICSPAIRKHIYASTRSFGSSDSRCLGLNVLQTRQHFLAIELDHPSLIMLARMYVDTGRASGEQVGEDFHVNLGVGAHSPSF